MTARRTVAATILLTLSTLLAGLGLAAPASADHVAEVYADSSTCVMGGQVSDIGPNLHTDHYTVSTKNGRTTKFVCHFSDVPPRSEWYTSSGYLWGPPETGVYRLSGFWCYAPEMPGYPAPTTRSELVVTPSGRATLMCVFER